MKRNDFETAKIISRPDSKQDEPANQEGSPNSTELEPVTRAEAGQPELESEGTEKSFTDIVLGCAEENKSAAEQGEDILSGGDDDSAVSKPKPTVSEMAEQLQTVSFTYVVKGLEAIGDIFWKTFSTATSKKP